MKRLLAILFIFSIPLLAGAAAKSPVHATKGFFVNDYAALLVDQHRDSMLRSSTDLYEKTGIRIILLTTGSLNGMTAEDYESAVAAGWGLTGNDILLFAYHTPDKQGASLLIGESLDYVTDTGVPPIEFAENPSLSILEAYRSIALEVYQHEGIQPGDEILAPPDSTEADTKQLKMNTIAFVAVLGLIAARSYRVSRKYKDKYLKGFVRKRKSFLRTYNEEDVYNNKKIYVNTYDDTK